MTAKGTGQTRRVDDKWITLVAFALMYNLVYLGRFSISNYMDEFRMGIDLTQQQQGWIDLSIFASYALGCFLSGFFVDRTDAKKVTAAGGIITSILNIAVLYVTEWELLFLVCIANGLAQSVIWIGGMNLIAQWFSEKEWGMSVGIANFFSGLSHVMAFLLPAAVGALLPSLGWRYQVILPILLLLLFTVLFAVLASSGPESSGQEPYRLADQGRRVNERYLTRNRWKYRQLLKYLFTRKYFFWWCLIAFISSICRYGLLERLPAYLAGIDETRALSDGFSEVILPLGMAFGTMTITWITGTRFLHNKALIVAAMAALCGSMVVVFPMVESVQAIGVGVFIAGFAIYGINGILWVQAIYQGGRVFAGTVAGILNGCAYLGATLQDFIFSTAVRITGLEISVFIVTELLCVLMILCAVVICKSGIVIPDSIAEHESKIA